MKICSLIFYKNIPGLTSWGQRKILGIDISHFSIYIGKDEMGNMMEFEANPYMVDRTTLRIKSPEQMEIYEINLPEEQLKEALNYIIHKFEETKYAYIQWLSIFLRVCFEWLGFENARSWKWLSLGGWGNVCSEIGYYLFERFGMNFLLKELKPYNPDLFHNGDIKDIIYKFPELFTRTQ